MLCARCGPLMCSHGNRSIHGGRSVKELACSVVDFVVFFISCSIMSVIYYKFKAAKDSDYDVFTFDGPGASVFDVKREIIRAKKLGKGTDFDLAIYNAQTDEGESQS